MGCRLKFIIGRHLEKSEDLRKYIMDTYVNHSGNLSQKILILEMLQLWGCMKVVDISLVDIRSDRKWKKIRDS